MIESASGSESVFKALASRVRREILFHLRNGELAAGEIASRFDVAAPTISRHLGVLKNARLVAERRDGNRILYTAAQDRIATTLSDFVTAVCVPPKRRRDRANATPKGGT